MSLEQTAQSHPPRTIRKVTTMGDKAPESQDCWGHHADDAYVGFDTKPTVSKAQPQENASCFSKLFVDSENVAGFELSGTIYATPKHGEDRAKYTTSITVDKLGGQEVGSLLWHNLGAHEIASVVKVHSHNIAGVNNATAVRNEVVLDKKRKERVDFDRRRVLSKAARYTADEV